MGSILTDTKKLLNIQEEDTSFDTDVIVHINSAFFVLNQLGVGPEFPFTISDSNSVWEDFLPASDKNFAAVKSYVYLKVRLVFDPPTISYVLTSMQNQINEYEWRFREQAEYDNYGGRDCI